MGKVASDEGALLRLEQLQKGLLQFTDTTNAYRLFKEYGKDIRYNALWKKWVVWNGARWEMDNGYLIHDRGLQMIRGIYRELLNTSDLRECVEIEKHAMQSESAKRQKP